MAMSTGAPQGKHLSSEGPIIEILPVLSGSFIAGCKIAGFFCYRFFPEVVLGVVARRSDLLMDSSRLPPLP